MSHCHMSHNGQFPEKGDFSAFNEKIHLSRDKKNGSQVNFYFLTFLIYSF